MNDVNFHNLEQGASDVIAMLKALPERANTKIAIIGGLAVWKYMQDFRTTHDVDFITTADRAPASVKLRLQELSKTSFEDRAGTFLYKNHGGEAIQIDMLADFQFPYVPEAAKAVNTIQSPELPYINIIDLIVFKIFSCRLRHTKEKKGRDARDARDPVLDGLSNIVKESGKSETWWKSKLGL